MNFTRKWTVFATDAEVEHFGTSRLVRAHNKLRAVLADIVDIQERDDLTDPDRMATDAHRAKCWARAYAELGR